jgi:hypothetical protein
MQDFAHADVANVFLSSDAESPLPPTVDFEAAVEPANSWHKLESDMQPHGFEHYLLETVMLSIRTEWSTLKHAGSRGSPLPVGLLQKLA